MQRLTNLKVLVIGAVMAVTGLSAPATAAAAPVLPVSAAPSIDTGSGATVTRTTTNGSTQISTEPRNRQPAEPLRVYGPYISLEQLRLVAD